MAAGSCFWPLITQLKTINFSMISKFSLKSITFLINITWHYLSSDLYLWESHLLHHPFHQSLPYFLLDRERIVYLFWCFLFISCFQIYVVDSLDRERIGKAKEEFQVQSLWSEDVIPYSSVSFFEDPDRWLLICATFRLLSETLNSVILVFANKQDLVCLAPSLCHANLSEVTYLCYEYGLCTFYC